MFQKCPKNPLVAHMFSRLRFRPSSKSLEASIEKSMEFCSTYGHDITTHHQHHPYPSNLWSNHIKSMLLFFPSKKRFLKSIDRNMPQTGFLDIIAESTSNHFLVAVNMLPGRTEVPRILVLISWIACSIMFNQLFVTFHSPTTWHWNLKITPFKTKIIF